LGHGGRRGVNATRGERGEILSSRFPPGVFGCLAFAEGQAGSRRSRGPFSVNARTAVQWWISFFIHQADRFFFIIYIKNIRRVPLPNPAISNQVYPKERQETAADELGELFGIRLLKVSIEDCAADDDGQSEEDELRGDHLRGVESLQGTVQIANLEQCGEHQDKDEQIGHRKSQRMPQGAGEK
jgi:hypothetical protein